MRTLELDHWVLFDTLNPDQIDRLKTVIEKKHEPEAAKNAFGDMLAEETDKLASTQN